MLTLLSAGSNAQGQLGNGTIDDSHILQACSFAGSPPRSLPSNVVRIVDIATGSNHTLALLEIRSDDGARSTEVWGCGDGKKGQLGPEYQLRCTTQEFTTVFQHIALEKDLKLLGFPTYRVAAIASTWETSYLMLTHPDKHDVVLSFGSNESGDLGIGLQADRIVENNIGIHIVDLSHIIVNGKLVNTANKLTVERMRAGQRHIILSLNVVWADQEPVQILVGWGASRHGQLGGSPTSSSRISHGRSIINKRSSGLLVQSTSAHHSRPILILSTTSPSRFIVEHSLGIQHSVFLHASGDVSYRGSNRKNQTSGLDGLHHVRDVKCTWNGTYALTSDDPSRILSMGANSHGQLGRNEDIPAHNVQGIPVADGITRISALACGSEHSMASLSADGREDEVWGWGWNEHGNLGVGHTNDSPTPVKIWPATTGMEGIKVHPVRNIWGGNGSSWIYCGTI